ncbi:MAG TPA: tyrosine-type recombinase/integrase, partial [Gemmatales bacterium]|nr:tyrosine-type recombinase/integrase [Gemmatales bacterium]
PKTLSRYQSALKPYLAFCEVSGTVKRYPRPSMIDREFRLAFQKFLDDWLVTNNGHQTGQRHKLKSKSYVLATVRALYQWASDPDRGSVLPTEFRNPFLKGIERSKIHHGDPLNQPDITRDMATEFLTACSPYELRMFIPLIVFGLRASEPRYLFQEHMQDEWLLVHNLPELDYTTKGRREKRFPLVSAYQPIWTFLRGTRTKGLLLQREAVLCGREKAVLGDLSLRELIENYQQGCQQSVHGDRIKRHRFRNLLLREAGALTYEAIEGHFNGIAKRLNWSEKATLKDFRHLFATTLASSGMPECYRRYLMGHAPGRDAIVAYTHLSDLSNQFNQFCHTSWKPLFDAINARLNALGLTSSLSTSSVRSMMKGSSNCLPDQIENKIVA